MKRAVKSKLTYEQRVVRKLRKMIDAHLADGQSAIKIVQLGAILNGTRR